jgi:glycosyltransferase involved in cell wall biosynthesis
MTPGRQKLLFVAHTFPYPPDGGVYIRTYNILRLLAQDFDVTILCFDRKGAGASLADRANHIAQLEKFGPVTVIRRPHADHRAVMAHVRSILTGRVFTHFTNRSEAFDAALRSHLDRVHFDLVHVDSLDLSRYLPRLEGLPVVCTHHNVESELLEDRARTERLPARLYLRLQAKLQMREERYWCPRVALNVTVSERDADSLRAIAPGARVEPVPNGVDTDLFLPDWESEQHGIVFVGGLGWFPNKDALDHFCEDILPPLRKQVGAIPIRWVGRASPEEVERYRDLYEIEVTGYVDDVRSYLASAACYVIPMRVGGGTRLKLLDAWAMGKAIVSTTQGVEGTEAIHGTNALIVDDPHEFASHVTRVLKDAELRERLGRAGRATAERLYSWSVIRDRQTDLYRKVIDAKRGNQLGS